MLARRKYLGVSVIVVAAFGLTSLISRTNADVLIRTELPETVLVADGATEYQMNVTANTIQDHPGIGFNLATWEVIVPDYVTVTGAELPPPGDNPPTNLEDFFNGFVMADNFIALGQNFPMEGGGILINDRYTDGTGNSSIGFSNGLLGTYFFTVNPGAEGSGNFDLVEGVGGSIHFVDESWKNYRDPCTWDLLCCDIQDCCAVHPDWCEGLGIVSKTNDTFTIVAPEPICGDGSIEGEEGCDDNNTADDDGCSSACTEEAGWTCTGEPSVCSEICGDGLVVGAEACDDGYTDDCGTCNATCTGPGSGSTCGDGEVCPELESCDDGYADACGTCDAGCTGPGTGSTCGDGESCPQTEECDDNNTDDGDGCSSTCTVEDGWDCSGDPSACEEVCGDGMIVGSEECDDGNTGDGDGCSATCLVEPGSKCTGEPSVCMTGIPAVSEWGLVVMSLLVLTAGTLVYTRRSPTHAWALSRSRR